MATSHVVDVPLADDHSLVRRLLTLRDRAARDAAGRFYVEGVGFVFQAQQTGHTFESLVTCPELLTDPVGRRLLATLLRTGVPHCAVTRSVFEQLAFAPAPYGMAAVLHQQWTRLRDADPQAGLCWLALHRLQSPGNLGTLLRTSAAVGSAGLFCLGSEIDPYQPSVVRPSMGAAFRQQFIRTSPERWLQWAERNRVLIVGTSPRGTVDYDRFHHRGPMVLCLGHERDGLSADEQSQCDVLLRIPMVSGQDSLNVATAGSVILYELFRQRRERWLRHRSRRNNCADSPGDSASGAVQLPARRSHRRDGRDTTGKEPRTSPSP
jgi:TrmH family RNA methyltransferase